MKNKRTLKTPWPTKAAMAQVYDQYLWGKNDEKFYSGEGSHDTAIVVPYVEKVLVFLKSFDTPLTVVDLGCGDFNVGKQLVSYTKKYVAVDIVPQLIEHNTQVFKNEKLHFQCLDIAEDILPKGDCAIVRQVLQHISNAEILKIIPKLKAYKYILLTEHVPSVAFKPNLDIISGQGTRLKKGSGVVLTAPPFNLTPLKVSTLLSLHLKKGSIVTHVIEMY